MTYDFNQNELDHHLDSFDNAGISNTPPPPPTWIDPHDYIQYDRHQKHYEVANVDGEIVETFPAKQKKAALRFAIALLSPELTDLVTQVSMKHKQLESRAWAAAQVVMSGKVNFINQGNVIATVQGSDLNGDYTITMKYGALVCSCPDFRDGGVIIQNEDRSITQICKHNLAIRFCHKIYQLV